MNYRLLVLISCIFIYAQGLVAQTFEIYNGDTINRLDASKKRYGNWIFFHEKSKTPAAKGVYIENRREELWILYYPSGQKQAEITYKDGRQNGPACSYYPDGKVSEKGVWRMNRWTGEYKAYHDNGKIAYDWTYNKSGKLTGPQKYYYPNGTLMIQGNWDNGLIQGELNEFYSDGSTRAQRFFDNGKIKHSKTKMFDHEKTEQSLNDKKSVAKMPEVTNKEEQTENVVADYFTGEGYHKLYKDSLLSREGEFKKGRLFNGKKYIYGHNRQLLKTIIYKDGRPDEVIPNKP